MFVIVFVFLLLEKGINRVIFYFSTQSLILYLTVEVTALSVYSWKTQEEELFPLISTT